TQSIGQQHLQSRSRVVCLTGRRLLQHVEWQEQGRGSAVGSLGRALGREALRCRGRIHAEPKSPFPGPKGVQGQLVQAAELSGAESGGVKALQSLSPELFFVAITR